MERRKFLIGMGAVAAGGAAAMSTGATHIFGVTATRTASIDVVGDANAYLGLSSGANERNSEFVRVNNGEIEVHLDDSVSGVIGEGVNPDAKTTVGELFRITNQAPNDLWVWITTPGVADGALVFFNNTGGGGSLTGPGNALKLAPGDFVTVGVDVDTTEYEFTGEASLLDEMVIHASNHSP